MSTAGPRLTELSQGLAPGELAALRAGDHPDPHHVLGAHPCRVRGREGVVVRAFHPDAVRAECVEDERRHELVSIGEGVFASFLGGRKLPFSYWLRFHFADGEVWERGDPYRFLPTLGDLDLHLFGEGRHRRLWEVLGAHPRELEGVSGTSFAVWAPSARRVSVVGDFCRWDGRLLPMRTLGASGVFELFVPGVEPDALYKYEIRTRSGALRLKTDPLAFAMEPPPATASRVVRTQHVFRDERWLGQRGRIDPRRAPLAIYETHLGSWARRPEEGDRPLGYRELGPRLARHARKLGFTHLELLPVTEHPFTGSWGYQVSGYYAPTARYGSPDDLRAFVETCHELGVGVILDWVPAHFPRDDFALARYDGTALYEHEDPRLGEHPDWGTLIFNFGRNEVRNFLVANALYWLQEFHMDGLRIDAVASMLYLDYSRKRGEWLPNRYGGRENLEAIEFLREVNRVVSEEVPGAFTAAEESTSWPGVTAPAEQGGLGFTFKWNMGWMHDTLQYFARDPLYRAHHQDQLSFAMLYEYHERFINPLSHDEVVHGKRSLLEKMPGDPWQKFANLRALLAYQYLRPGKKLLFMGTELAPEREWNHDRSLDWHLESDPPRQGLAHFLEQLGRLYHAHPCLWRGDPDPENFEWIDASDRTHAVFAFLRRFENDLLLIVFNLTPVPQRNYRVGVPAPGRYLERLCSDRAEYGGSGYETPARVEAEAVPWHGRASSVRLVLPPLAVLALAPDPDGG